MSDHSSESISLRRFLGVFFFGVTFSPDLGVLTGVFFAGFGVFGVFSNFFERVSRVSFSLSMVSSLLDISSSLEVSSPKCSWRLFFWNVIDDDGPGLDQISSRRSPMAAISSKSFVCVPVVLCFFCSLFLNQNSALALILPRNTYPRHAQPATISPSVSMHARTIMAT